MSTPTTPLRIYERTLNLDEYRNRTGTIRVDDLHVSVQIKDARLRFGHLDLLVVPVSGSGERWVESHRVDLT